MDALHILCTLWTRDAALFWVQPLAYQDLYSILWFGSNSLGAQAMVFHITTYWDPFEDAGIEPKAFYMQDRCSIIEPHPHPTCIQYRLK